MSLSLYGRKWQLKIECNDGEVFTLGHEAFNGSESIKLTFDINYPGYEGWYLTEFNVYNMSRETRKKIIQEGAKVYFYAGYKDGDYGQIFGGTVFQSLFTRENVNDYVLTLRCMDGDRLFKNNIVSLSMNKSYTDYTLINEIAACAERPISVGKITDGLHNTKMPRGTTIFGSPATVLREVVRANNAQMYMVNDQLQVAKITDDTQGEAIVVNSKTGLIGSPEQIDFGINFRVLLNPNLIIANPPRWIQLDLSQINVKQQRAIPGQNIVPMMPQDGYFKIGGVRHTGDTRGDTWYTDVRGYSLTGKAGLQLTVPEMLKDATFNPN